MRLLPFVVVISACAGKPALTPTLPDYRPIATEPPPPPAELYASCLADATAQRRFRRAHDASTSLLLFTCTGAPARSFYDGLAAWSAQIGSQFQHASRTYRSTSRVQHNLFGVDYCATAGTVYECVITLNVGAFVR
ncbi:MAG: hypothetical protein WKG01_42630 [Kofleriaceae bacterium]